MKKLFMIALAGMMMLAFTQCNKGSKEFKDGKKALEEMTKLVKGAKTCEEFQELGKKAEEIENKLQKNEYKDGEKMTKEEEKQIEKMVEEFATLSVEKANELCK